MTQRTVAALPTQSLDYDLPQRLIATQPVEPRDSARMMVLKRSDSTIEHQQVRDLPEYVRAGDALVLNNTSVVPARLIGRRGDTGGRVEGLFVKDEEIGEGGVGWRMMLKAGGRLRPGIRIDWLGGKEGDSGVAVELVAQDGSEWIVRLASGRKTGEALAAVGRTPLPPYILQARGEKYLPDQLDRAWYQTVYAEANRAESVAAPTAGLHFTPELISQVVVRGVEPIHVTLHVGPGTFKPVTAETLDQHRMHSESFRVEAEAVAALRRKSLQRQNGEDCRIIAVGTTAVRTLESLPSPLPDLYGPIEGMTDLLIAPPYEFQLVHGMLTNFHLPRSTLMALVAAMLGDDGVNRLLHVYREAISREYRFYSYGDAMLILP